MKNTFKTVNDSRIVISELMLPSHTNFSGKIHGGYILSLLDQIAFACASKFSGHYCVTASVDTVDFLAPIEVGELVTMKASVNYVGRTSMIVGIRVEAENIQTGIVKHCNSSYFTMVAKDKNGTTTPVPGLILNDFEDVRRFYNCLKTISNRKEQQQHEDHFNYKSPEALAHLSEYKVKIEI
ncbi:acyl-CoA thioesterase [Flavobacterium oreochromis]|uniref:Acyl-CoA thioesterase n=2 Tax=Flavobacterium TaxID=237 RepID=A0A246G8S7_9FLAO|nr:acyl-CoA thioesterase [Flavobacterium oreochromis]OWP75466.1 acyl-CoA thioesterase [Flavobacterium oreochromis]OWP76993.1 acyl-CoA thioesterase [Flavobacterium oreochromis]POR22808.1 acyl-CoA thioesterase [Flavobacterium columnare]QYS85477.1 acyl-CoA thioesterase [Flavobacterium oreochromis]